jgi:hypothetical protein
VCRRSTSSTIEAKETCRKFKRDLSRRQKRPVEQAVARVAGPRLSPCLTAIEAKETFQGGK